MASITEAPAASDASSEPTIEQADLHERSLAQRLARVGFVAGAVVIAGLVLYAFTGYLYGYADHTLLMIKGLSWADGDAFRNDWFNSRAPQPHWLFDVITFLGERSGHLPGVYFVYFIATLVAFGIGTAYLAWYWLPANRRPLALGAVLLSAAGPKFVLGEFLPLESQALPNLLGGALSFAAAAAIVSRRYRAAVVLSVLTGLVHVQHGTVLAIVLIVAAILHDGERRTRWAYGATAAFLIVLTGVVARARGLTADNSDMIEICERASPGHCNANVWADVVVRHGLLIVGMCLLVAVLRHRDWRRTIPVIVLPAIAVVGGLAFDRYDVRALGELSQRLFPYRVNSMMVPFAPWAIVLLVAVRESNVVRLLARAGVAIWLSAFYISAAFSITAFGILERAHLQQAGAIVGALLCAPMVVEWLAGVVRAEPVGRLARSVGASVAVVAIAAAGIVFIGFDRVDPGPLHLGFRSDDGNFVYGRQIEAALPPGSVLAHSPELDWVRLVTRRAVVGNCKAIPYGGKPWEEYKERMAALGAPGPYYECTRAAYEALSLRDIEALRRFDATHVLLLGADPKIQAAQDAGWPLVWTSGPGAEPWYVFEIPDAGAG